MVDPSSLDFASPPEADVTDARRGDAWFRSHLDGRVLADLRWLGNQYQILVFRLPEREKAAEGCCTENTDLARRRADRLVREEFPHECDPSVCAPWIQYSEA